MKTRNVTILMTWVGVVALLLAVTSANATLVNVNEIIYQTGSGVNAGLYSGTVDVTGFGSSILTIVVRNTSADGAVTDPGSTAQMLLSGIGFVSTADITSASGTITTGSTALNFGTGATIDQQWDYANSTQIGAFNSLGTGVNRILTTVDHQTGLIRFNGTSNPNSVDGPSYGMVSASESQFGSSLAGVQDSITFTLNFSNVVNSSDFTGLVLAFGSPNAVAVPEAGTVLAGTLLLLPFSASMLRILRKQRAR